MINDRKKILSMSTKFERYTTHDTSFLFFSFFKILSLVLFSIFRK